MRTAKVVLDLVKTDHKFQGLLAVLILVFGIIFVAFFGKPIGLDTDTKALITFGLAAIVGLISFFVQEKCKSLYMFMCGFFSAAFLIFLAFLLGETW